MCSAVSKHTPREGKIDVFLINTLNNNFLLNLKRLFTKFQKVLVKNLQFYYHFSFFVIFKGSD